MTSASRLHIGVASNPVEFIQAFCEEVGNTATEWKNGYDNTIRSVIAEVKKECPVEFHRIVEKILLNLPETVAVLSIFSDTLPVLGSVYLGGRFISIISPVVQDIVNERISENQVQQAGIACGNEFQECLKPALYVAASIASVYLFIKGIVTADCALIGQGFLYGVAAQILMNDLNNTPFLEHVQTH